jgi:hypothetical protein
MQLYINYPPIRNACLAPSMDENRSSLTSQARSICTTVPLNLVVHLKHAALQSAKARPLEESVS